MLGAPRPQHTPLDLVPAQHLLLLQRFDGIVLPRALELDQEDLKTRERFGLQVGSTGIYFPCPPPPRVQSPLANVLGPAHPLLPHLLSPYLPEVAPAQHGQAAEVLKPGGFPARKRAQEAPSTRKGWASARSCSKPPLLDPGWSPSVGLQSPGEAGKVPRTAVSWGLASRLSSIMWVQRVRT